MASQEGRRLPELPVELQLAIYEYSVIEAEPTPVNSRCKDYYESDEEYTEERDRWESGQKRPAVQAGVTRTCRTIRRIILPMFDQRNAFRVHHCPPIIEQPSPWSSATVAAKWLEQTGDSNRRLLRGFSFVHGSRYFGRMGQPLGLPTIMDAALGCRRGIKLQEINMDGWLSRHGFNNDWRICHGPDRPSTEINRLVHCCSYRVRFGEPKDGEVQCYWRFGREIESS